MINFVSFWNEITAPIDLFHIWIWEVKNDDTTSSFSSVEANNDLIWFNSQCIHKYTYICAYIENLANTTNYEETFRFSR